MSNMVLERPKLVDSVTPGRDTLRSIILQGYLHDLSGNPFNAETFGDNWEDWYYRFGGFGAVPPITQITLDQRRQRIDALTYTEKGELDVEGIKTLTKRDPLMFALVFLKHAMKDEDGSNKVTFSDFSFEAFRDAFFWRWTTKELEDKYGPHAPSRLLASVAPRQAGKTHYYVKILPLWAAAHGHIKFMCYIADTAEAASQHFDWWRDEVETNEMLRAVFPEMVERPKFSGGTFDLGNGFRMKSGGITQAWRGTIRGNKRPDYVVMDDVDANLKTTTIDSREEYINGTIKFLSRRGRIRLQGTTTTPDNITHSLLKDIFDGPGSSPPWCADWEVCYIPPIVMDSNRNERSFWPAEVEYLQSKAGKNSLQWKREYDPKWASEMENRPVPAQGGRWTEKAYLRIQNTEEWRPDEILIHIDPISSAGDGSDFVGICVIGWKYRAMPNGMPQCAILHDEEQRGLVGFKLRDHIQNLVKTLKKTHGWHINGVILEQTGTGGENWWDLMAGLSVPLALLPISTKQSKEARILMSATWYAMGYVLHLGKRRVETQQLGFRGKDSLRFDDLIDVVATAVLTGLEPESVGVLRTPPPGVQSIGAY